MTEFHSEFIFKGISIKTNDGNPNLSQNEKIEYHQTQMKKENCHKCFQLLINNKCVDIVCLKINSKKLNF